MSESPNLKLILTDESEADLRKTFLQWRKEMSGSEEDSNLMKIDKAIGELQESTDAIIWGEF